MKETILKTIIITATLLQATMGLGSDSPIRDFFNKQDRENYTENTVRNKLYIDFGLTMASLIAAERVETKRKGIAMNLLQDEALLDQDRVRLRRIQDFMEELRHIDAQSGDLDRTFGRLALMADKLQLNDTRNILLGANEIDERNPNRVNARNAIQEVTRQVKVLEQAYQDTKFPEEKEIFKSEKRFELERREHIYNNYWKEVKKDALASIERSRQELHQNINKAATEFHTSYHGYDAEAQAKSLRFMYRLAIFSMIFNVTEIFTTAAVAAQSPGEIDLIPGSAHFELFEFAAEKVLGKLSSED